jgi:hypothetical protein
LGCPTVVGDLKKIIKMNSIKDFLVTVSVVDLSETIYGPDVASLKGKVARKRPTPVVQDIVEIPRELIEAQHWVDLVLIPSLLMDTRISLWFQRG